MKKISFCIVILLTILVFKAEAQGQKPANDFVAGIPVNYDESKAGTYTLPDPLVLANGRKVKNARQWFKKRRPEIVALFEEHQYGKVPPRPADLSFNVFDKGTPALNGAAIRKQVTVYFTKDTSSHKMDILIYIPANATKPVPVFFNVGFMPNATVTDDPGIKAGLMRDPKGNLVPVQRKGGFGRMDVSGGPGVDPRISPARRDSRPRSLRPESVEEFRDRIPLPLGALRNRGRESTRSQPRNRPGGAGWCGAGGKAGANPPGGRRHDRLPAERGSCGPVMALA